MSILTVPQRLAQMLADCHPTIVASYYYTQESIDQVERPCWLIFVEDASYPGTTVDQEQVEQGYSIAYVGQVFSAGGYVEFDAQYEQLARKIAEDAVRYLLSHPQGQVSNTNNLLPEPLGSLDGITSIRVNSRSGVTLFSRDAVEGSAFWGFTIDITVTEQFEYETVG